MLVVGACGLVALGPPPGVLPGELVGAVVLGDGAPVGREALAVGEVGHRAEDLLEARAQLAVGVDRAGDLDACEGVLEGILEGDQGLRPEAVRAAVPEEPALVRDVPEGGRVSLEGQDPLGQRPAVREAVLLEVAGRAGDLPALGEGGRVEQVAAELGGALVPGVAVGRIRGDRRHGGHPQGPARRLLRERRRRALLRASDPAPGGGEEESGCSGGGEDADHGGGPRDEARRPRSRRARPRRPLR